MSAFCPHPYPYTRRTCRKTSLGVHRGHVVMLGGVKATSGAVEVLFSAVNMIMRIAPLRSALISASRAEIRRRAERVGVPIQDYVRTLRNNRKELERLQREVQNMSLKIPQYYQREFHTYREGNLGWAPAFEEDPLNVSVHSQLYVRDKKRSKGELDGAYKLRTGFLDLVCETEGMAPTKVLDMGCSTGFATFLLQERFPEAEVIGLDLSPYMLAVAKYKTQNPKVSILDWVGITNQEKDGKSARKPRFVHGLVEDTPFEDDSFDLVCLTLVLHELPERISKQVFREAYRVLRKNGVLAVMDSDPSRYRSRSPALMALFQVSEPYITEFKSLNQEEQLKAAGFRILKTAANSPAHCTIICRK